MCFLRLPSLTRWLELHKMVSCTTNNWEGWLEDATLFPSIEPNDILNFDEILDGRNDNELPIDIGSTDLDWLDQKVDFSLFDFQPTEEDLLLLNDAIDLAYDPITSNLGSHYLSSDLCKNQSQVESQISDFLLASPDYEAISPASSPAGYVVETPTKFVTSIEFPSSAEVLSNFSSPGQVVPEEFCQLSAFNNLLDVPGMDKNQSPDEVSVSSTSVEQPTSNELCPSPSDISFCSSPGEQPVTSDEFCESPGYNSNSVESDSCMSPGEFASSSNNRNFSFQTPVSVVVCNVSPNDIMCPSGSSDEDSNNSEKKGQYLEVKRGAVPKLRLSTKEFHPYAKSSNKKLNKYDRKKVQNKEAAARYRIKKKMEEDVLLVEEAKLKSTQKELQDRSNSLASEIKYLKSLMCEMLKKKGIM